MLSEDFIRIVDNSTYGAKMPRASWNFIGTLKISKPNKKEQKKIIEFIESENEKIDKAITTIVNEIALVQEYRTAFIAETITGKIDVRDFNIPNTLEEENYEELEEELDMVAEDGEEMEIE